MTGQLEFLGYHRADGRVGVRNLLLVLSCGGLTGQTARRIASAIAGAVVVTFPYGAGLIGKDETLQRVALCGLAGHPNVGATLLVGDNPRLLNAVASHLVAIGKPHVALSLDDCGHDALTLTDRGLRAGASLARQISGLARDPASISALCLGLECGRSDPSSGLIANPLTGLVADRIVDEGGTAMIGETLEWMGAEHLLARRARTPAVAESLIQVVQSREAMAMALGVDLMGNNPTPTNIVSGLSSIEEKALGSICKSGSRIIEGVIDYGEPPRGRGLWAMDGAAYSPESLTGFVIAGAQLLLFTTGVGNSYVSAIAPTIKISANPNSARVLSEQLDFDASCAFSGHVELPQVSEALFAELIAIASGKSTWGEILREGDEVVSRFSPAL